MIKSSYTSKSFLILIIILISSLGLVLFQQTIVAKSASSITYNPENINQVSNTESKVDSLSGNAIYAKSSTDNLASVNTASNFNYYGQGNSTLLKANESFSLQESNSYSNSIAYNTTTASKSVSIPSFNNYNIVNGNYSVDSVHSTFGNKTVEGSTKTTGLSTSTYSAIASSFTITEQKVNISAISVYLTSTNPLTKNLYSVSIVGISAQGTPNGTTYFQQNGIQLTSASTYWVKIPLLPPYVTTNQTTFSKGTYAVVVQYTGTTTLNYNVVPDSVNGDQSFMWTKKAGQNWNTTEYPADLPFYYSYMILDPNNASQPLNYPNPAIINLKINNQPLNDYSALYNALTTPTFNFSSNISVSLILEFKFNCKGISPLNVNTYYNSTIDTNYWTASAAVSTITVYMNPILVRNLTIINIPSEWAYNNSIYNGPIQIVVNKQNFAQSKGIFSFLTNSPSSGPFKVIFKSVNYVQDLNLFDNNYNPISSFIVTADTQIQAQGVMAFNPTNSTNVNLSLETPANAQVYTFPTPTNYSSNYYNYSLFNISTIFNLNSNYQGKYKLVLTWANPDLTKIGYYELTLVFAIKTVLTTQLSSNQFYISENIHLDANFTDFFNQTVYSTNSVNYTTDWGLNGSLIFNSANNEFQINISTLLATAGEHNITVYGNGSYFVNQSVNLNIKINYIPTSLPLVSKTGFTDNVNNITQLSNSVNLIFSYKNMLNASFIQNTPQFYLNGNEINISSNSLFITVNLTSSINININLNPDGMQKIWKKGNYNLTIVENKLAFQPQVHKFLFSVTGYNLSIDLSYGKNYFVPGQDFNIKASIYDPNQSNVSSYNKLQLTAVNKLYYSNIKIFVQINGTKLNGGKVSYTFNGSTDDNGTAYIDIPAAVTQNMKSFDSLLAYSPGSDVISSFTPISYHVNIINVNYKPNQQMITNLLFLVVVLLLAGIIGLGGGLFVYRTFIIEKIKQNQEYGDYINSVTNFLGLYITNKEGLPLFLKSNQRLEDQNQHLILSGVTYSIDLFLNNFKDEYMKKILKDENTTGSSNTGLVHMTVINQENFKILIGVSESYRMYVLIKDSNDRINKVFQTILTEIENTVSIRNTIIDLKRVAPLFTKAIETFYPIELVNEFEINFQKLIDCITINERPDPLSASTIGKLKDFGFYLIKHSNLNSIELDENFAFTDLMNYSKRIQLDPFTLPVLVNILNSLRCSKKELYEILFICAKPAFAIFKNITPLTLPDDPSNL